MKAIFVCDRNALLSRELLHSSSEPLGSLERTLKAVSYLFFTVQHTGMNTLRPKSANQAAKRTGLLQNMQCEPRKFPKLMRSGNRGQLDRLLEYSTRMYDIKIDV
jgi:hypothetical protein